MKNQSSTPHPQHATVKVKTPSGKAKIDIRYERPTPNTVRIIAPHRRALAELTSQTVSRLMAGVLDVPPRGIRWHPSSK